MTVPDSSGLVCLHWLESEIPLLHRWYFNLLCCKHHWDILIATLSLKSDKEEVSDGESRNNSLAVTVQRGLQLNFKWTHKQCAQTRFFQNLWPNFCRKMKNVRSFGRGYLNGNSTVDENARTDDSWWHLTNPVYPGNCSKTPRATQSRPANQLSECSRQQRKSFTTTHTYNSGNMAFTSLVLSCVNMRSCLQVENFTWTFF